LLPSAECRETIWRKGLARTGGTGERLALENSTRMLCIFQSSNHNGLFSFKEKYHNHFLPKVKSLYLKKKKPSIFLTY
jgi:hypothetical protein